MPKVTSHSVPRKVEHFFWDMRYFKYLQVVFLPTAVTSGSHQARSSVPSAEATWITPKANGLRRARLSLPVLWFARTQTATLPHRRATQCPTRPLRVHLSPLNHVFSSFFHWKKCFFWTFVAFVFSFLVLKDDATWWVSSIFKCFSVTIAIQSVQVEMFPWKLDMLVACVQARESFVITTGTSKLGSSPTKSKVCWVTNDDQWWLQQTLLLIAASIPTDSEHSEPRIWWFWWLEVVVISRVHPSRIFLHQQTHYHSQWSLWVPLPQGKKSKKKKSTCCWGGHFRSVVETTRVSWPDLPFPWIWARKPRTARQQKI